MVKLQKRFSYSYKDKDHFKHILTIPEKTLSNLGWKEGIELEPKVQGDKLIIKKKGKINIKK